MYPLTERSDWGGGRNRFPWWPVSGRRLTSSVPLQLLEFTVPESRREALESLLGSVDTFDRTLLWLDDKRVLVRVVLEAGRTEPVLDEFRKRFPEPVNRVVVLEVAAASPTPPPTPAPSVTPSGLRLVDFLPWTRKLDRVSRQELIAALTEGARLTPVFLTLVVLSTIVVVVGFYENNVALIVGAMLIAPLIGPNVSLSLATTTGNSRLARQALGALAAGFVLVVLFTGVLGLLHPISANLSEVSLRTHPGLGDAAVAFAVGIAAVLSYTTRLSTLLVGVAVAVALLPPFAVFGLLVGSGHFASATGAFLLGVVNLIGINLAGTVTLAVQGVRPFLLYEKGRAIRDTVAAVAVWAVLFVILILILISTTGLNSWIPHILP